MIDELEKVKEYDFPKESYTFCTTAKRDTRLQDRAVHLTQEHGFLVSIRFWDEIKDEVLRYHDLKIKYFRDYLIEVVKTDSIHMEIDVWDTCFDLVIVKMKKGPRFGEGLLMITSLSTRKSCFYYLGDYYYSLYPIVGLGRTHAFVLSKWLNQFSSFEDLKASYKASNFYIPQAEIDTFIDHISSFDNENE